MHVWGVCLCLEEQQEAANQLPKRLKFLPIEYRRVTLQSAFSWETLVSQKKKKNWYK